MASTAYWAQQGGTSAGLHEISRCRIALRSTSRRVDETLCRMDAAWTVRGARMHFEPRKCGSFASCAFAVLAAWWSMPAGAITSVAWSLLPRPAGMHPDGRGTVTIGDGAVVTVSGAQRARTLAIARRFAQRIADIRGLHLRVTAKEDAHALIAFAIDPAAAVAGDEGYRIVIGESGIQVIARSSHGLFDGSVTLWQLLTPPGWVRGAPAHVADGTIDDHPRFAWRSLLLDSGRHFQSVPDIEKLIDWMSLHK